MGVGTASDHLRLQILGKRITTSSNYQFIPEGALDDILDKDALIEAIGEHNAGPPNLDTIVRKINSDPRWKKTFAALLLHDAGEFIGKFMRHNEFIDSHHIPPSRLKNLLEPEAKIKSFDTDQWMFLAPVFENGNLQHFDKGYRLPFMEDTPLSSQGANSRVFEVTVPETHFSPVEGLEKLLGKENLMDGYFKNDQNKDPILLRRFSLVRKQLEDEGAEDEARIHDELKHDCIVPLYSSYRYNGKLNLLLPKYSKRLDQFLKDNPMWNEQQYVTAIYGLSGALEQIHHNSILGKVASQKGCHRDLKPNNVLVHNKKFVLIDFGLTRMKSATEDSNVREQHPSGWYVAPECVPDGDDDEQKSPVYNRKSDIWSFGCILAELVVYMNDPRSSTLKEYKNDRKVMTPDARTYTFHDRGKFNQGTWIILDKIDKGACSQSMKNLIKLIRNMLEIAHERRPDATEVTQKLANILNTPADIGKHLQSPIDSCGEPLAEGKPPCGIPSSTLSATHGHPGILHASNMQADAPGDHQNIELQQATKELLRAENKSEDRWRRLGNEEWHENPKQRGLVKTLFIVERNNLSIPKWATAAYPQVLLVYTVHHDNAAASLSWAAERVVGIAKRDRGQKRLNVISFPCEPLRNYQAPDVLSFARSLLSQVTRHVERAGKSVQFQASFGSENVGELMQAFHKNLELLPPDVDLICVLDRVDHYEKASDVSGSSVTHIIESLVERVRQNVGLRMKVLITLVHRLAGGA